MSDTLQSDWEWLYKVTVMLESRVEGGERVQLRRPRGFPKNYDPKYTMIKAMQGMMENILSTAEVIEPEEADGVP